MTFITRAIITYEPNSVTHMLYDMAGNEDTLTI